LKEPLGGRSSLEVLTMRHLANECSQREEDGREAVGREEDKGKEESEEGKQHERGKARPKPNIMQARHPTSFLP